MASIDLASGINFIESLMVDQCVITRDTRGVLDDTLNMATGELVRPGGDTTVVYSGKCIFRTKLPRQRPPQLLPGEGPHEFKFFEALLPISAIDVELGDIVQATVSTNDPRLLTRAMQINDVSDGSLQTYRTVLLGDMTYQVPPED